MLVCFAGSGLATCTSHSDSLNIEMERLLLFWLGKEVNNQCQQLQDIEPVTQSPDL